MSTKPAARVLAAVGLGLWAAGCDGPATAPGADEGPQAMVVDPALALPSGPPEIRGTVTRVQAGDSVPATAVPGGALGAPTSCPPACGSPGRPLRAVLVEGTPGTGKSYITVPAGARVLRRPGAEVAAAGFASLRTGQRVDVWYDGPVRESYPTQGNAGVIVILDS